MTTLAEVTEQARNRWAAEMEKGVQRERRIAVVRALNEAGMGGMTSAAKDLGISLNEMKSLCDEWEILPQWEAHGDLHD